MTYLWSLFQERQKLFEVNLAVFLLVELGEDLMNLLENNVNSDAFSEERRRKDLICDAFPGTSDDVVKLVFSQSTVAISIVGCLCCQLLLVFL